MDTIIKIVTDCVPKGLVPDKYAQLLYQYSDNKWYAVETNRKDFIKIFQDQQIYLLHREYDQKTTN